MRTHNKSKLAQGFSLVELLVVIAVIAVIAAIAIPSIQGTREAAINAAGAANTNEATRFLANIQAMGATNTLDQIVPGFSWTNTATEPDVVFTFTSGN